MAAENKAGQTVLLGNIWELRVTLPKEGTVQIYLLLGLWHHNIMLGFPKPQNFFLEILSVEAAWGLSCLSWNESVLDSSGYRQTLVPCCHKWMSLRECTCIQKIHFQKNIIFRKFLEEETDWVPQVEQGFYPFLWEHHFACEGPLSCEELVTLILFHI